MMELDENQIREQAGKKITFLLVFGVTAIF